MTTAKSESDSRDFRQVFALDDQLRRCTRTRKRAGDSEKSTMRLIIGRKDVSQGVYDHLPCFRLAQ